VWSLSVCDFGGGVDGGPSGNTSITFEVTKVLIEVKGPLRVSKMAISTHIWQGKPPREN